MSTLDVLVAAAGLVVSVLVIAGMVLLTPGGVVELEEEVDSQGADLSRPARSTRSTVAAASAPRHGARPDHG